jgi:hypothetical protein
MVMSSPEHVQVVVMLEVRLRGAALVVPRLPPRVEIEVHAEYPFPAPVERLELGDPLLRQHGHILSRISD